MRHIFRTAGTLRRAALLALVLSMAAGLPGSGAGPLGGGTLVTTAGAASFSRVASLGHATRATSISIPRLHISMTIREGVLGGTISRSFAYHYPATSWPGGHSNTYIYAHAQTGAFLNLKYARKGDILTLRLTTGRYVKYKVTGKYSVAWNDLRWLKPTTSERITLQTCLGHTATSRRLVVIAVPVY